MLSKILFETRAGEKILSLLETRAGLAVVKSDWLAEQQIDLVVPETQPGQGTDGPMVWEASAVASITPLVKADN